MSSKETVLHNKRFLVIEELNSRLVDMDYAMRSLVLPVKYDPTVESEKNLFSEANNTFQKFNMYFEKNKIYFSVETCNIIENIREKFYTGLWDYSQPNRFKGVDLGDGGKTFKELMLKAVEVYGQVKNEFPVLRAGFEKELRQILSVAEKTMKI
jgi:hypothetical protein